MNTTEIRKTLADGGIVLGNEVHVIRSAVVAEIYKAAGFDFIMIDCEHTGLDFGEVTEIARVARLTGIAPFVRVPEVSYSAVCRSIDQGVQGIIVPRVETADQAAAVRDMIKYPPLGRRGMYPGASSIERYRDVDPKAYVEEANRSTMLAIMVEREPAVKALDSILAVPGIDLILVGPVDLSTSVGVPCQVDHERVVALMDEVISKCRKAGIPCGTAHGDPDFIRRWIGRGMQFFWVGNDVFLLLKAAREQLALIRQADPHKRQIPGD
jgi:2-keto-3-deoxy-L-rhamnonate aldolase RhmA